MAPDQPSGASSSPHTPAGPHPSASSPSPGPQAPALSPSSGPAGAGWKGPDAHNPDFEPGSGAGSEVPELAIAHHRAAPLFNRPDAGLALAQIFREVAGGNFPAG